MTFSKSALPPRSSCAAGPASSGSPPGRGLKARRATTLLELLVVVTIMLLITGIAIRTVMPAIEGRQIREGARQLNVFINSARNRAMVTGRPMGVWIDRLAGLPEAAMAISYAQVPEP
ncbi:MAG TPA: hypothetical protein VHV55_01200, partial [Pirellulales bacterium]|nr:hypothetical protein [Pirellulales bacterium]